MTRNDYERIAAGLRRAWQAAASEEERVGVEEAAGEVAKVFAADNARFDYVRFWAAVKVEPEGNRG